jgi:hypothetical protein
VNVFIYFDSGYRSWNEYTAVPEANEMGRPDSTQAPIPVWGEYDDGMQSSAAPPPYSLQSAATSRPIITTPSRSNSSQKHAYKMPSPTMPSNIYSNTESPSASSSVFELDVEEGSIPPPGDTGVTRRWNFVIYKYS